MAIPLETFEYYREPYNRWPGLPWRDTGQIPDAWFKENCRRYLYSVEHIAAEADLYIPEQVPSGSGIYFLLAGDRIIYVGLSANVRYRLLQHQEKGWSFNRFWCFGGVPELYISHVEAHYIHTMRPCLNMKYPIYDAGLFEGF